MLERGTTTHTKPGRRGREARRAQRQDGRPAAAHTGQRIRRIPVYDMLDADAVEEVHDASVTILERIGIDFRDDEAIELWRAAGAEIDGWRVRIPRDLLMAKVALAPAEFTHHARNPAKSVRIGGDYMAFAPIYGSPFIRDLDGNRRYARLEDFQNLVKLAYMSPALNLSGGTVCEPTDVPVAKRHLDMLYAHIRYSDKPFMGGVTSGERAQDCVEMCKLLFGADFVRDNTVMVSLINCNSPLVWDGTMLSALKVYARSNQAVLISPFIMQGANTPITTAGAFAQLNAEALAGIAFAQLVRPGAPVIYGATLSTVSMGTGAPTYGTSETQLLTFLTGQLARRYRVPMRTGGMRNGSKAPDAQAAYESLQTMFPAILAGGHFFLHSAGWLESGLSACYAKFILDVDQLIVLQRLVDGLDLSADALAFAAVEEVGPGGHFLGCSHTLRYYDRAFFIPQSASTEPYEQWVEGGAIEAPERARSIARRLLASYERPPLDPAIDDALKDFIARRKSELPDGVA
jgi:trimethylamine--corrinoid protein Co-methyltransferase